jgi:mannosyl-3-phosphoglycerate phosphatase
VDAVVFSDLDGTLLELETSSSKEARPAVDLLRARGVPLVLCSSKTRTEIEHLRRELALDAPFIVENGSAVFIPAGSFDGAGNLPRPRQGYMAIELGLPVGEVRRRWASLRAELGVEFRGYGDLSLRELRRHTGLDEAGARRASRREYSETLLLEDLTLAARNRLQEGLAARGLSGAVGSRFFTVTGLGADKGRATRLLLELYRREDPSLISVGLGDGPNDGPMLAAVDLPFLVQRPAGTWAEVDVARLVRVGSVGPAGFREAVTELFGHAGRARDVLRLRDEARMNETPTVGK